MRNKGDDSSDDSSSAPTIGAINLICTGHIKQTHANLFANVCFFADSAVSGLCSSSDDTFFEHYFSKLI